MATSSSTPMDRRIALQRFGLGPKLGSPIGSGDAKAMVLAEIDRPADALIVDPTLPTYATACAVGEGATFQSSEDICEAEMQARFRKCMVPTIGFAERLVHFWSNHFSMTVNKADIVRATYGQLERDVIRPQVFGRFSDMLKGVIGHPAMIAYLDNGDSIGPNTPDGQWAGLNENLAREILELHTVGTGGGYTEHDVNQFARIITGWSWVRGWEADMRYNGGTPAIRGRFFYRPTWHEPGPLTLMGKTYPAGTGRSQGLAALLDLANHEKTAEHIAFKLVRHFITDNPTAAQIAPIKQAFVSSRGNLATVSRALVNLADAWTQPLTKIRTPYELLIAQFRAFGGPVVTGDDKWNFRAPLYSLRNMTWEHGAPDGWSDETPTWVNPDAARVRLDAALFIHDVFFRTYTGSIAGLAQTLFGDWLSPSSKAAIGKITDRRQRVGLLLTLPELQRR